MNSVTFGTRLNEECVKERIGIKDLPDLFWEIAAFLISSNN